MLWFRAILITLAVYGFFAALPLVFMALPFAVVLLIVVALLKDAGDKKKPP